MMQKTSYRITRTWLLLILLTLVSMGAGHLWGARGIAGSAIILSLSMAKGRWMLMDFLKFRYVPSSWRALFLSWIILIIFTAWLGSVITMLHG